MIMDSDFDHNFIRENVIIWVNCRIIDTKHFNVLFVGEQSTRVTTNISTELNINGKTYQVNFYILAKMLV